MNRLTQYFDNAKLAKLYLNQSQAYLQKKELPKAIASLTTGMIYLVTAMNNVASIGFGHKPKKEKKHGANHARRVRQTGGLRSRSGSKVGYDVSDGMAMDRGEERTEPLDAETA